MVYFYITDQFPTCTPINICGGATTTEISNSEEDTFWSPSMTVPPHSPPLQNTSHETRSAPSTPNNNRSGTSPPEAAIEATPETTPVKVCINNFCYYFIHYMKVYFTFYIGFTKIINETSTFGV